MRQSWAAVVVACACGVSMGAVNNSLQVTAPVIFSGPGDIEVLGPRSVLVLQVPPAQATANTMTGGQPITIGALWGVQQSGGIATSLVDISSAIVSPPSYNNSLGTTVTINLNLVPNIADFFLPGNLDGFEPDSTDDVVAVNIRLTTADRNLNVDGVELFYDNLSFSEDGDRTFSIDQEPPRLVAAYRTTGTCWLQFSEALSNGQSSNNQNQTVLANVTSFDFQTNAANVFGSATGDAGAPFAAVALDDGGTTIRCTTNAGNAAVVAGRFIRCRADDAGWPFIEGTPVHDVRDVAGNVAVQLDVGGSPTTQGVVIVQGAPPVFRQWASPGSGGYLSPPSWNPEGAPGPNDTLRIDQPGGVSVEAEQVISESRRLLIGGNVSFGFGFGDAQPAFLSYTETSEPSLVVGYQQLFGALTLSSNSTIASSFVISEWTHVGGPGAGIATLNIGDLTVVQTGKLLIEGPPSTLTVSSGGALISGFDNGVGGVPPDFETRIGDSAFLVVEADGLWDSNGPAVVEFGGTLEVEEGATAGCHDSFVIKPGGSVETSDLTIGLAKEPPTGLTLDRGLVMDASSSLRVLDTFNVLPTGRVVLNNYAGQLLDIQNSASLDGSLIMDFAPGFDPSAGESFFVLSPSFTSGRFALHVLPAFADDRVAVIEYVTPALGGAVAVSLTIETLPSIIGMDSSGDSTPVAGEPVRAASGDLTGDGFEDLAVVVPDANPALPGSVIVLINNADPVNPGYSTTVQLTVGPNPTDVAIGDFDAQSVGPGQSDLDLAVTCAGDDSLRIYQNDGTATGFAEAAVVAAAGNPVDVDTADVNADERDDVLVTCRDADVVRVLVNESSLVGAAVSFGVRGNIAAGDEPVDCDPVDLDNDKDVDVVTGGLGSGAVGYATNDSEGNFGPSGFAQTGNGPNGIDTGDLDGDGDADVVTANLDDGTVSVLANTDGVPSLIGTIPVGSEARSVAVIDLDNDGDNDIAVVAIPEGLTERVIQLLRNDTTPGGPPTFAAASTLGGGNGPVYVLTGDVNNDGREDVISVDSGTAVGAAAMAVPSDQAGRVFGGPDEGSVTVYLNYTTPSPACAGDANLDGRVDGKDLSGVLSKFGQAFAPLTGPNLNGDLVVNSADLSVVLSSYGSVCGR